MEQYQLNNDRVIPCIGFGTFPQKQELEKNIPIVLKHGYRLIDTSDNYYNEGFVGRGIGKAEECTQDLIITTKFSQPLRTRELEKCFAESKERLGGQVHIYLLHWPYPFLWKMQWKKMEELYMQGECQVIGVCNFEKNKLKKLLKFCRIKPMINQYERHPLFQQQELTQFCFENNIQVMSYSPIARKDDKLLENETLKGIAEKYGKSVGQIILRWNIEHKCIPIPGSSSEIHIKENIDIFDFELTKAEIKKIDELEEGYRIRFDPKKRFSIKQKWSFLICFVKNVLKKDA